MPSRYERRAPHTVPARRAASMRQKKKVAAPSRPARHTQATEMFKTCAP